MAGDGAVEDWVGWPSRRKEPILHKVLIESLESVSMRLRTIIFLPLGAVLLGTSLAWVSGHSPSEGYIFGEGLYLKGAIASGLCLALGTIEWEPFARWYLPLVWYPGWCLVCVSLFHLYLISAGVFLWPFVSHPLLVGGIAGGVQTAWRWRVLQKGGGHHGTPLFR